MQKSKQLRISLLTGGDDPSYALPLLSALVSKKILVDFIGSNRFGGTEILGNENVNYLNLRGDQNHYAPIKKKIVRVIKYYCGLTKYAARTDSEIFHILWLNKFVYFDRTILNLYYKLLGKKLIFTAHNVNIGERDENDSIVNRLTLKIMYRMCDHIFVHTEKMKQQLIGEFKADEGKVTVIPFGINTYVPTSNVTHEESKRKLELEGKLKVMLFFGQIAPYKGLDHLVLAFEKIVRHHNNMRLIIAGGIKEGSGQYWEGIDKTIETRGLSRYIMKKIGFIPDEDVEIYFKASDVLVLPYRNIFQTGVLFLSYNFGLPAIATDVGSLREDIIEGETGFICEPGDPEELAKKIEMYFNSDIYVKLGESRERIKEWAMRKYSWDVVGEKTCRVYEKVLSNSNRKIDGIK